MTETIEPVYNGDAIEYLDDACQRLHDASVRSALARAVDGIVTLAVMRAAVAESGRVMFHEPVTSQLRQIIDDWVENGTADRLTGYAMCVRFREAVESVSGQTPDATQPADIDSEGKGLEHD